MKKKFVVILALIAVLVLTITSAALAKDVTYTLKGMVTTIEEPYEGTITIFDSSDSYVDVFLPEAFDIATLAPGYTVSLKGLWIEGGFDAEQVTIVSDILVGIFFGVPELDPVTGGYFITIKLSDPDETVVTVLLPLGFPIDGLVEDDTWRFKGSWDGVEGVFVVDEVKGVCLEGTVTSSPVEYMGTGRYVITISMGIDTFVDILLPDGFDIATVAEGDIVRACGAWVEAEPGYYILDAFSAEVNPTDEEEVIEPGGRGGVYCDGLKEKNHPLWDKIAEMYGVPTEWVKEQFCLGFGYGEIMIALKIRDMLELEGVDVDPRWILSERAEHGWGYIKKFFENYTGPEDQSLGETDQKEDKPLPPGLAKKLNDDSDQNGPPGWAKKADKGKGHNKNK